MQIHLKDGSVMSVNVTVVPSITGTRTPLSPADAKFLRESTCEDKLACSIVISAEVYKVDMLVGNDYYFDLLQPRKTDLRSFVNLIWLLEIKWNLKQKLSEQNLYPSVQRE